MTELLELVGAILVALGGGSVVVIAAGSWLGKVWAGRILETDRAKYAREMESLRSDAEKELARLSSELEAARSAEDRIHSDKLVIYRAATDIVTGLVVTLQKHQGGRLEAQEGLNALDNFERGRLQLYAYLGMLAPQEVMDAQDALMEYLLEVIHGQRTPDWGEMRIRALRLLNEIRRDVGIDKSPIEYRGSR